MMGRTHTRRTNTGLVNWAARAVILGAVLGLGVVRGAGMCREYGEWGGAMMICGRSCEDHPTTLTASWWAGYLGREGRGKGRATGRAPESTRRNLGVHRHLCENLSVHHM